MTDGVKGEQSLAPEWLSFSRELPSSSQDKAPKHNIEREKHRHFAKHNSYHQLTQFSPSPSYSYALSPSTSSNWRHADPNPRMLNRSKSSPVFDSKENGDTPKSPDRSNQQSAERHFVQPPQVIRPKPKLKGRPPLISSRSQPNLLTDAKPPQKFRSPPVRGSSFLSLSSLVPLPAPSSSSSPSSPSHSPVPSPTPSPAPAPIPSIPSGPTTMAMAVAVAVAVAPPLPVPVASPSDEVDMEMEKLRTLVPSPSVASAPKPARLVGGRKGSHPKPLERPKKPATPPSILHLRKFTSEPALLANPNGAANSEELRKMKAINAEKAKIQLLKETVEEKDKVVANRNNFFMDVIKRERQILGSVAEVVDNSSGDPSNSVLDETARSSSPATASDSPPETNNATNQTNEETNKETNEENNEKANEETTSKTSSNNTASNEPNTQPVPEDEPLAHQQDDNNTNQQTAQNRSATAVAVEAEERFLRLLGWVPDEEDHVPELDEEEIAEVRLKINNNRHQNGTIHSPTSPLRSNYTAALGLGLGRSMMTVSIHQD